jgi:hypothetical protein
MEAGDALLVISNEIMIKIRSRMAERGKRRAPHPGRPMKTNSTALKA